MLRRFYDATWGRAFARGYDWFQRRSEEAGMEERRAQFLATARGRCLEIGAGTGLNITRWPQTVDELVFSEPDPHMVPRLRKKVEEAGRRAEVVQAPAEKLPFPDHSFDTIALTHVLCTVPEPEAALREFERVLKPGGRLLFLEHVRSPEPGLAAGRTGCTVPGTCSGTAVTATATRWPRSRPHRSSWRSQAATRSPRRSHSSSPWWWAPPALSWLDHEAPRAGR